MTLIYWCKIWRKTDLCVQKWREEFGKFSSEHSKVSKLGLCWNPFIKSRKCISLKFKGEFEVMFDGTCGFKNDMKNSANFHSQAEK